MPIPHVLSTRDLSDAGLQALLRETKSLVNELGHRHDRTEFLSGRNIVLAFFEPSTRTRLSFETAAHRLGAQTVVFMPTGSSVEKGESFLETIETITAMKFDAMILRHQENGLHAQVAQMLHIPVINAGEGTREHPTQALLDMSAILTRHDELKGLKICIVGDIRHSRVARSQMQLGARLGCDFGVCAPDGFHAEDLDINVQRFDSVDEALEWCDVVSLLRIQRERITDLDVPNIDEYRATYALTLARAQTHPTTTIIHPGPVNLGVELDSEVLSLDQCLVHAQVTHGVAVRMALLELVVLHHPHHFNQ